jgi:hypothetical protein
MPKADWLIPKKCPSGGKATTARRLKMKIVESAYAISAPVALTIPDTAAIADAPTDSGTEAD